MSICKCGHSFKLHYNNVVDSIADRDDISRQYLEEGCLGGNSYACGCSGFQEYE